MPRSIGGPGIALPPDQDTLLSPNYQLAIPKKQAVETMEETEEDEGDDTVVPSQEPSSSEVPQQHAPQRVSFPLAKRPKLT